MDGRSIKERYHLLLHSSVAHKQKGSETSGLPSKHVPCPCISHQFLHRLYLITIISLLWHYIFFVLCYYSFVTYVSCSTCFNTFFVFQISASLILPPMAETHSPTPTLSSMIITTPPEQASGFDWTVLVAAIICAFLCALGLNTMLQCAGRVLTEPLQWIASRRHNSGLKRKEMVALPTSTYSHSGDGSPSSSAPNCAICLAEFCDGDQIRFLPQCNHHFHVVCIDKWLLSHSSCPTCRHLLKSNDSLHSKHIVIA